MAGYLDGSKVGEKRRGNMADMMGWGVRVERSRDLKATEKVGL